MKWELSVLEIFDKNFIKNKTNLISESFSTTFNDFKKDINNSLFKNNTFVTNSTIETITLPTPIKNNSLVTLISNSTIETVLKITSSTIKNDLKKKMITYSTNLMSSTTLEENNLTKISNKRAKSILESTTEKNINSTKLFETTTKENLLMSTSKTLIEVTTKAKEIILNSTTKSLITTVKTPIKTTKKASKSKKEDIGIFFNKIGVYKKESNPF